MTAPTAADGSFPLDQADLCVKCGLCLPHCPTYGQTRHEGDSPRGRISLMQGVATGALAATPNLEAHLDGCLGCRACERVCPAKVPYGQLLDESRAMLARRHPARTRTTRVIGGLLSSPLWRGMLRTGLGLYRGLGLQRLLRRRGWLGTGTLGRLESLLPTPAPRPARPIECPPTPMGELQLFTGCLGPALEPETLDAIERVFAALGHRIVIPPGQTCCGAIHQHGGLPDRARRNAERNLTAFATGAPIVYAASGCGATLLDYARLVPDDARATTFVDRLADPCAAALERWDETLSPTPLPARVAVHVPCTQRNVIGGDARILQLLAKIPQIELFALDPEQRCCGAAGTHFVTHPGMADRLLEPKLASAESLQADYIVSTNIGCSLHLAGGLRRRDGLTAPEVLHPLALLARQLPAASARPAKHRPAASPDAASSTPPFPSE